MHTYRDLTNTRREDILKAAKYHYKVDDEDTVEVLRHVIAFHNGVELKHINDDAILKIMMNDCGEEVKNDPRFFDRFIEGMYMNGIRWAGWFNEPTPSVLRTMLLSYLSLVTLLERKYINNESLPDNCPVVEQLLLGIKGK